MLLKEELKRITSVYFEDNIDYKKLVAASKELKNLLNKLCGEEMDNEDGRVDVHFDNGKALSTYWAALCIDDFMRTRQFIRGINKAIKEKSENKVPLHILYAGTGPFATLILPFICSYSKEKIKYTLLEINTLSFRILKKVISKLGVEDHAITLLQEDATKYKIGNDKPDIIISETMQNALAKEQQVSIYYNLMRQVNFNPVFIPEKIEIFIGVGEAGIPTEKLQRKHFHKQKKVFEVSKTSMRLIHQKVNQPIGELTFQKNQTVLNKENLSGCNQVVLITEIQVYKHEKIRINESGLTTPLTIKTISDNFDEALIVNTQYIIGPEPKLEFEITSVKTL